MRPALLLVLPPLLALAGCGGIGVDPPAALNQKGLAAAGADRNEEALGLFLQACAGDPRNATLRSNAGLMAYRLGRHGEAHAHLLQAAALDPNATVNRSAIPVVDWLAATEVPARAAAAAAANLAGVAAFVAKDPAGAERWYRTALDTDRNCAWAAWNLGTLLANQGRDDEAVPFLDLWLDYAPAYAPYRAELGLALLKDEARAAAFQKEEQAGFDAECAGDWAEAYRRYARAWALLPPGHEDDWWGNLAGNLIRMRRRLPSPPPMPETTRRLLIQAEIHAKEKRYAEAALNYQRVINACPWSNEASSNRALLRAEIGDLHGAVAAMMHYVDYFPDAPDVRQAQDQIYAWEAKGVKMSPAPAFWKPWFGFNSVEEQGVSRVTQVARESAAERAGLKPGDRVLRFRGEAPKDQAALFAALRACVPGQEVEMTVDRDGREVALRITVAHRCVGPPR